jgi:hypothetical protein
MQPKSGGTCRSDGRLNFPIDPFFTQAERVKERARPARAPGRKLRETTECNSYVRLGRDIERF